MIDPRDALRSDREGIALAVVVMVIVVIVGVSATAAIVGGNAWLINAYDQRQSVLQATADAGLAEAQARINGDPSIYPDSGYAILENQDAVEDAHNAEIPGVHRYTYVGPTGATTGQYGVFGSIVVVAEDGSGTRVVRRREVTQESFAKFAYFTDEEPSNIAFGGGDQIFGPVHTNDELKIYESGATFHGEVTTARDVQAEDPDEADFLKGYTEYAQPIPMPDMADLEAMSGYAEGANLSFDADPINDEGLALTRIEFFWKDLDDDGEPGANEGFIRVYEADGNDEEDARWVVAAVPESYDGGGGQPTRGLRESLNCGDVHTDGFISADAHDPPDTESWNASVRRNGRRCFLGGTDSLWTNAQFRDDDGLGRWLEWPGQVHDDVRNATIPLPDEDHLFPISRALNPNYKGVIYVDGTVAVSGVVRGQVTLAATGDIIIVDDITYTTLPGDPDRSCVDEDPANHDILGLFAGGDVLVANNTLNAPWRPRPNGNGNDYFEYDDSVDEIIHATLLTLNQFRVQDYDEGPTSQAWCGSSQSGRGCLAMTGGIVQQTRGPVGLVSGEGYLKSYSYDSCVVGNPPPYFPTTGRFDRARTYEIDPTGFDVDDIFDRLTPNND